MEDSNVLVVAFDGLDFSRIQSLDLNRIRQFEFGKIDNQTRISKTVTPELFASFLTGSTHKRHGVTGFRRSNNRRFFKLRKTFYGLTGRKSGLGKLHSILEIFLDMYHRPYDRRDYNTPTLFDEIENSKSLNVPGYDRVMFLGFAEYYKKFGREQTLRYFEQERQKREEELFEELGKPAYNFLMAHFHKPDAYQDLFYKYSDDEEREKVLNKVYADMEDLASRIKKKAEGKYDTIIFMSDHGMPTEKAHNENAFYSCNHKLFPDSTPHITDFHDKILELTSSENSELREINKPHKEEDEEVKDRLRDLGYM
ncbi:MAG: alkaline phosphatase family protein [Candidatus Nanohaloarchaea archaeon]